MIPQTFIETAGDILGSTEKGLSGSKIASLFAAYAVDYNTDIPYPSYPFPVSTPNKRHALKKNLSSFNPKQQFNFASIRNLKTYLKLEILRSSC